MLPYNIRMKSVILASNSPRRKQLLADIVKDFSVIPCTVEERPEGNTPADIVRELATAKASYIAEEHAEEIVIGADTIVVLDGKILGKPHSVEQATEMLSSMSGRTHQVFTGVCICFQGEKEVFFVTSQVTFSVLTQERIAEYIASGSPFDKAGGYGIQDSGFVQKIIGSYTNVMGLPVEELTLRMGKYLELEE